MQLINTIFYIVLFIYLLVAIRVMIFFIGLIRSFVRRRPNDKVSQFISQNVVGENGKPIVERDKHYYIKSLIPRGIFASIGWVVDFYAIPKIFVKAHLLHDKVALLQLGIYYGQTSQRSRENEK